MITTKVDTNVPERVSLRFRSHFIPEKQSIHMKGVQKLEDLSKVLGYLPALKPPPKVLIIENVWSLILE